MKTWAQLTAAERIEVAISQDRGDNRDAAFTAQRLGIAEAEVQRILAHQSAAWAAGKAARLKAQQIVWPKSAPPVCASCIAAWVGGVLRARAALVHERRQVECPHVSADGSRYLVAFLAHTGQWLVFEEVPGADTNRIYADLMLDGGASHVEQAARESRAIAVLAAAALRHERMLRLAPLVALGGLKL